ncbi:MAG: hypothetical protein ACP5NS_00670 [Candidatus Pacearchaeota archaeon]
MIHKRGLAPVMSIALITLGVIVAVVMLWIFASDTIKTRDRVIDPECFTADLSITNCQTYGACSYLSGGSVYTADILVKRGAGKANLTGLRFSFEDFLGRKILQDRNLTSLVPGYSLEELQSLRFKDYPLNKIPVSGPENTVRVVPLVGKDYEVCPLASQPAQCSLSPSSGPLPPTGSTPGLYDITGQCCQCPRNESECYNGLDDNYPLQGGIVYNTSDPSNSAILPTVYSFSTPPGNFSVCCAYVPKAYAGLTIGTFTYPAANTTIILPNGSTTDGPPSACPVIT